MFTQQLLTTLHFTFVLPVFGGLAVAYAFYDLLDFSLSVALGGADLFWCAAIKLRPAHWAATRSWPATLRSLAAGTGYISLIPLAFGTTFLVVERLGSFPAISAAALATVGAALLAHTMLIADGGGQVPAQPPPDRDEVLRGEKAGGYAQRVRDAHVEAQKKRRGQ